MTKLVAAAAIACALLSAAAAGAAPGRTSTTEAAVAGAPPISWGVADDTPKYANDRGTWFDSMLKGANLTENRWTLTWDPANPTAITDMPHLLQAAPIAQQNGIRVILVLYPGLNGTSSPDARALTNPDGTLNVAAATAFCTWAGTVAQTVQQWGIHDFVVLNEPNTALYWAPQKDAARNDIAAGPVEAVLAQCYDTIHAADATANVIGLGLSPRASTEKSSNDPLSFLRDIGAAYRASGRIKPIMDQLALHPYPVFGRGPDGKPLALPPSRGYANTGDAKNRFSISQLDRVKQAVYDAFNGTSQPTTLNGLTFLLDEVGWQTDTSQYPQYFNAENVDTITEQQQTAYLEQTITQYFACDPTVTEVNLFLLVDEATRNGKSADGTKVIGGGWQSGLLTAGGQGVSQPKPAYAAVGPLFGEGRSACQAGAITWTPGAPGSAGVTTQGGNTTGSGVSLSGNTAKSNKAKAARRAKLKAARLARAKALKLVKLNQAAKAHVRPAQLTRLKAGLVALRQAKLAKLDDPTLSRMAKLRKALKDCERPWHFQAPPAGSYEKFVKCETLALSRYGP